MSMLDRLKNNNHSPIFITLDDHPSINIDIPISNDSNMTEIEIPDEPAAIKVSEVDVKESVDKVSSTPIPIPIPTTSPPQTSPSTPTNDLTDFKEPSTLERIRYAVIRNLLNYLSRANFNQMFMSYHGTSYAFNKIISSDNVCIVGNAPNLLGKGKGQLINKYQQVIRFTDFKIAGFENDVGTKVNIWITGGAKQTQIKKRLLPPNTIQLYLSPNQYTVQTMSQFIMKNLQMNPKGFIFYKDIAFMRMIMKSFGIYPSTGLATIFILIAKFGKVDTIGFDFYQNGIHYYNNKYVINSEHNWKKEYEIYHDLIKLGYVRQL